MAYAFGPQAGSENPRDQLPQDEEGAPSTPVAARPAPAPAVAAQGPRAAAPSPFGPSSNAPANRPPAATGPALDGRSRSGWGVPRSASPAAAANPVARPAPATPVVQTPAQAPQARPSASGWGIPKAQAPSQTQNGGAQQPVPQRPASPEPGPVVVTPPAAVPQAPTMQPSGRQPASPAASATASAPDAQSQAPRGSWSGNPTARPGLAPASTEYEEKYTRQGRAEPAPQSTALNPTLERRIDAVGLATKADAQEIATWKRNAVKDPQAVDTLMKDLYARLIAPTLRNDRNDLAAAVSANPSEYVFAYRADNAQCIVKMPKSEKTAFLKYYHNLTIETVDADESPFGPYTGPLSANGLAGVLHPEQAEGILADHAKAVALDKETQEADKAAERAHRLAEESRKEAQAAATAAAEAGLNGEEALEEGQSDLFSLADAPDDAFGDALWDGQSPLTVAPAAVAPVAPAPQTTTPVAAAPQPQTPAAPVSAAISAPLSSAAAAAAPRAQAPGSGLTPEMLPRRRDPADTSAVNAFARKTPWVPTAQRQREGAAQQASQGGQQSVAGAQPRAPQPPAGETAIERANRLSSEAAAENEGQEFDPSQTDMFGGDYGTDNDAYLGGFDDDIAGSALASEKPRRPGF